MAVLPRPQARFVWPAGGVLAARSLPHEIGWNEFERWVEHDFAPMRDA